MKTLEKGWTLTVDGLLQAEMIRYLFDGIDYPDLKKYIIDKKEEIKSTSDWCRNMMEAAEAHRKRAEKALEEHKKVTAGDFFVKASMLYHYGCYLLWPKYNAALRKECDKKKVETYKRGGTYIVPPAERIEIPFENYKLPGYLRLPPGKHKPPCVVLVGGRESTKEEYYTLENQLLKRGVATFAFDGPGEGEVLALGVYTRHDYEKPVSAVIDYLRGREEIDTSRIGVNGRSFGGYKALRAAAHDDRVTAVSLFGSVDFDTISVELHTAHGMDGWESVSGKETWEETIEYFKSNFTGDNYEGLAKNVKCPLYILQGSKDTLHPTETAKKILSECRGPSSMDLVEGGAHCAHDEGHIWRPRLVDWIAKSLGAE